MEGLSSQDQAKMNKLMRSGFHDLTNPTRACMAMDRKFQIITDYLMTFYLIENNTNSSQIKILYAKLEKTWQNIWKEMETEFSDVQAIEVWNYMALVHLKFGGNQNEIKYARLEDVLFWSNLNP